MGYIGNIKSYNKWISSVTESKFSKIYKWFICHLPVRNGSSLWYTQYNLRRSWRPKITSSAWDSDHGLIAERIVYSKIFEIDSLRSLEKGIWNLHCKYKRRFGHFDRESFGDLTSRVINLGEGGRFWNPVDWFDFSCSPISSSVSTAFITVESVSSRFVVVHFSAVPSGRLKYEINKVLTRKIQTFSSLKFSKWWRPLRVGISTPAEGAYREKLFASVMLTAQCDVSKFLNKWLSEKSAKDEIWSSVEAFRTGAVVESDLDSSKWSLLGMHPLSWGHESDGVWIHKPRFDSAEFDTPLWRVLFDDSKTFQNIDKSDEKAESELLYGILHYELASMCTLNSLQDFQSLCERSIDLQMVKRSPVTKVFKYFNPLGSYFESRRNYKKSLVLSYRATESMHDLTEDRLLPNEESRFFTAMFYHPRRRSPSSRIGDHWVKNILDAKERIRGKVEILLPYSKSNYDGESASVMLLLTIVSVFLVMISVVLTWTAVIHG